MPPAIWTLLEILNWRSSDRSKTVLPPPPSFSFSLAQFLESRNERPVSKVCSIRQFEFWNLQCAKIKEVRILFCWRSPRTRHWRTRLPWSSPCSRTSRRPSTSCFTMRCPPTSFTTTSGNISSGNSPPSLRPLSNDVPGELKNWKVFFNFVFLRSSNGRHTILKEYSFHLPVTLLLL